MRYQVTAVQRYLLLALRDKRPVTFGREWQVIDTEGVRRRISPRTVRLLVKRKLIQEGRFTLTLTTQGRTLLASLGRVPAPTFTPPPATTVPRPPQSTYLLSDDQRTILLTLRDGGTVQSLRPKRPNGYTVTHNGTVQSVKGWSLQGLIQRGLVERVYVADQPVYRITERGRLIAGPRETDPELVIKGT